MDSYLLLHQYLFCIKQANKICTLLSSHSLALIVFSVQCFCFMRGLLFWSPIQTLTPPDRDNFSEKCQVLRGHSCGEKKLWGNLKIINYQHVSPEANVSRFSFICYSSETGMLYFNTTQFSAFWFSGNPVYASLKHFVCLKMHHNAMRVTMTFEPLKVN